MTKKKKLTLQQILLRDAGKGLENFNKVFKTNVFKRASKIKTWNMFIHLVEQENISPAEALTIILKHLQKSTVAWNKYKIARDPDQTGAIMMLLDWQQKMGARKLYDHKYLKDFCTWTGYKRKGYSRFQDDLTTFRDAFGLKRKKKRVPYYKEKEFKI